MSVRAALLEFLRVPAAPSAPVGDADVHIFRAAPNYFRYRIALWMVRTCGAIIGVLAGIALLRMVPGWVGGFDVLGFEVTPSAVAAVLLVVEAGAVLALVVQALVSLALLRLDFEQRWYIVSDRSLRIREGLLRMHEKTMTFANIQQVTIEQGPLQRLLGIADLRVRTAGGGGSGGEEEGEDKHDLHVAYFHGVADAPRIRDTIRERLRRHADAGLGDPDDRSLLAARPVPVLAGAGGAEGVAAVLASARELAAEARALRAVLRVADGRTGPV